MGDHGSWSSCSQPEGAMREEVLTAEKTDRSEGEYMCVGKSACVGAHTCVWTCV